MFSAENELEKYFCCTSALPLFPPKRRQRRARVVSCGSCSHCNRPQGCTTHKTSRRMCAPPKPSCCDVRKAQLREKHTIAHSGTPTHTVPHKYVLSYVSLALYVVIVLLNVHGCWFRSRCELDGCFGGWYIVWLALALALSLSGSLSCSAYVCDLRLLGRSTQREHNVCVVCFVNGVVVHGLQTQEFKHTCTRQQQQGTAEQREYELRFNVKYYYYYYDSCCCQY